MQIIDLSMAETQYWEQTLELSASKVFVVTVRILASNVYFFARQQIVRKVEERILRK